MRVDLTLEESELPGGSDLVDYLEAGFSLEEPEQPPDRLMTQAEKDVSILYKKNVCIHDLIEAFDLTDELGFKIRKL